MENAIERAYEVLTKELVKWFDGIIRSLPNLLIALIIGIIFWMLGNVVRRLSHRLLSRTEISRPLADFISKVTKALVLCLGLFLVLGVLDLQKTVASLLAGAGVVGLVLGLAFQDFMSNFFASILISARRPFVEGDIIETNKYMGTVQGVNLRNTRLRNFDGQQVLVPNKIVVENPLINYTRFGVRRISVQVGVSYDQDLAQAEKVAVEAIKSLQGVLATPPVIVHFYEFGSSSINLYVRFWISYPGSSYDEMLSAGIVAVRNAFVQNNIPIPFPITTIDWEPKSKNPVFETAPQGQKEERPRA